MIRRLIILIAFLPSICWGWFSTDYPNRRVIYIMTDSLDSENLTNVPAPYWWADSLDITGLDTNRAYVNSDDLTQLWASAKEDSIDWIKIPQQDSTPITDSFYIYYGASSGGLSQDSSEMVFDTTGNDWQGGWHFKGVSDSFPGVTYNANYAFPKGAVVTDTTGYIGKGIWISGASGDSVIITQVLNDLIPGKGTVMLWCKLTSLADNKGLFDMRSAGYFGAFASASADVAYRYGRDGNFISTDSSGVGMNWGFWAFTRDSSSEAIIYKQGKEAVKYSGSWDAPDFSGEFYLGRLDLTGSYALAGFLDEVFFTNDIKSAEWIQNQYLAQSNLLLTTSAEESEAAVEEYPLKYRLHGGKRGNLLHEDRGRLWKTPFSTHTSNGGGGGGGGGGKGLSSGSVTTSFLITIIVCL